MYKLFIFSAALCFQIVLSAGGICYETWKQIVVCNALFSGTINAVFYRLSSVTVSLSLSLSVCQRDKLLFYILSFECCYPMYGSHSDTLFCQTRMAVAGLLSFFLVIDCCGHISAFGRVSLASLQWYRFDSRCSDCLGHSVVASLSYALTDTGQLVYCHHRLFSTSHYAYAYIYVSAFCSLCTIIPNNVLPLHMNYANCYLIVFCLVVDIRRESRHVVMCASTSSCTVCLMAMLHRCDSTPVFSHIMSTSICKADGLAKLRIGAFFVNNSTRIQFRLMLATGVCCRSSISVNLSYLGIFKILNVCAYLQFIA